MATRLSNIRTNVNATTAVSGRSTVSHDLKKCRPAKTWKSRESVIFLEKGNRRVFRMVEKITENGSCTRDDLHEHWSPGRTVA